MVGCSTAALADVSDRRSFRSLSGAREPQPVSPPIAAGRRDRSLRNLTVILAIALGQAECQARELRATPEDYVAVVRSLRPGDNLRLAPGTYTRGLSLRDLRGEPGAPIVIRGPSGSRRAVFPATRGRNVVSLIDTAHVVVASLDLIGPGADVDAVNAEHKSRFAHHIVLEDLRIVGFNASQQVIGISTKCPAWNWTIRRNVIVGAGTGLYLGDSDGTAPFVAGTIEENVVVGTTGYAMQIKHQRERPVLDGLSARPAVTVIRYNTFAKDHRSSTGALARPNVLLGHWPPSGAGSSDRYLFYGNLLVDNPSEALFQAEGNLAVYNNLFVNRVGAGVAIRDHNGRPKYVDFFHNTVIARTEGVTLLNPDAAFVQRIESNLVFAREPVTGVVREANIAGTFEGAAELLASPHAGTAAIDLVPLPGRLTDPRWSLGDRADLPDVTRDAGGQVRLGSVPGGLAADSAALRARFRNLATLLQTALPQTLPGARAP